MFQKEISTVEYSKEIETDRKLHWRRDTGSTEGNDFPVAQNWQECCPNLKRISTQYPLLSLDVITNCTFTSKFFYGIDFNNPT